MTALPRVVVAGLAGDTGKSLVALGLIGALRERGHVVAPFKKGPDFIDAAWLGAAAGADGRNLDTYLMAPEAILHSVAVAAGEADVAVVEGARGIFDGMDAAGTHSTAQLAKLIGAPVVLVIDATKVTRTVAAMVAGCRALDPKLVLAGVVLNRVASARHEGVIREAVTRETGLPVLGAIPKLKEQQLPSRHLGLLTAAEHPDALAAIAAVTRAVDAYVDVDSVIDVARIAAPIAAFSRDEAPAGAPPVRIGVLRDRAFSFYYPENLEALESAGAELVIVSPLADEALPRVDALYAGGGFPEVYAAELAANAPFRESLRSRIAEGLPVYAECGGLMYLSRSLRVGEQVHPMVGALPVDAVQTERPQGHGYVAGAVDGTNPFLEEGLSFVGHEFHYSHLSDAEAVGSQTVYRLDKGVGAGRGRDGLRAGNVLASYTHLHALGTPDWAAGLVNAARGGER